MRRFLNSLVLLLVVLSAGPLLADDDTRCDHSTGKSRDNFFPIVRLQKTVLFNCDNFAISTLGEIGPRSFRANGTWGFFSESCHRFKVGGEYLGQKFRYKFPSGRAHRWVHQWAIGGKYQYLFDCGNCLRGIQLEGSYAHAKTRRLNELVCTDTGLSLTRRIGGSWFADFAAGLILVPWECSNLVATLSYDQVRYHHTHRAKNRLDGLGVNFDFQQALWRAFSLDVKAQFKRPYNYLEVLLNWGKQLRCGDLTIGAFVNHVWGKFGLPSSTTVGLEASLSFGIDGFSLFPSCPQNCDECGDPCESYNCCTCDGGELSRWVSDPAVYMPQVLAVKDFCNGPTASTIVLPPFPQGTTTFNVAQFFTGNDLTFTATNLPSGVTLSSDGVLTVVNTVFNTLTQIITVTADSDCGSTTASATIFLEGVPV